VKGGASVVAYLTSQAYPEAQAEPAVAGRDSTRQGAR